MSTRIAQITTMTIFISIGAVLLINPVVSARKFRDVTMLGLIQRIDRQSREIVLWEYQSGDSVWTLQVPGTEDLRRFQVGDYVQVTADSSRRVLSRIRKLPPPNDERYHDAMRRLEGEEVEPAPSPY